MTCFGFSISTEENVGRLVITTSASLASITVQKQKELKAKFELNTPSNKMKQSLTIDPEKHTTVVKEKGTTREMEIDWR